MTDHDRIPPQEMPTKVRQLVAWLRHQQSIHLGNGMPSFAAEQFDLAASMIEEKLASAAKAPASCPQCHDATDCANVDICNAVAEVYSSPAPTEATREARFFIDHGMIHDRATGKHVSTEPDSAFCDGIVKCCQLLNELAGTPTPPMKLHFTSDWLQEKINTDPDIESDNKELSRAALAHPAPAAGDDRAAMRAAIQRGCDEVNASIAAAAPAAQPRTCATCHAVLADRPQPLATYVEPDKWRYEDSLEKAQPWAEPLYAAPPAPSSPSPAGTELEVLKDPVAVHLNMLRGSIAKPSLENIKHLYPEVRDAFIAVDQLQTFVRQVANHEFSDSGNTKRAREIVKTFGVPSTERS